MAVADHPVKGVKYDGPKVTVECMCGWVSKPAKTETEARALHEAHAKK